MKRIIFLIVVLFAILSPSTIFSEENKPEKKVKLVSLSPNLTSIIIYLGFEENLVGVTRFCKTTKKIDIVGDFLAPDIEKIITINPDYVFLLKSQKDAKDKLAKFGVKTIDSGNDRMSEIIESIELIGKTLGAESKAKELCGRIKSAIQPVNAPESVKPRILFVVGKQGYDLGQIYVTGRNTFIDDLIIAAGGENAIQDSVTKYPIISKEALLAMNPDIILDSSPGNEVSEEEKKLHLESWNKLINLKAVKNKKIFFISDPDITIPGASIPESIEKVKKLIK